MEVSAQQLAQFDRDGFLVFPNLFSSSEVAVLRREVAGLSHVTFEEMVREHAGGVRTIFQVYETDGRRAQVVPRTGPHPARAGSVRQVIQAPNGRRLSHQDQSRGARRSRARCGGGGRIFGCRGNRASDAAARNGDVQRDDGAPTPPRWATRSSRIPGSPRARQHRAGVRQVAAYKFWAMPRRRHDRDPRQLARACRR